MFKISKSIYPLSCFPQGGNDLLLPLCFASLKLRESEGGRLGWGFKKERTKLKSQLIAAPRSSRAFFIAVSVTSLPLNNLATSIIRSSGDNNLTLVNVESSVSSL